MAEARSLPIPAEHRELVIKVEGQAVPREHQLLAASVSLVMNRIGSARLVYVDGAAASSDFPLSGQDLFLPGKRIEVQAGSGNRFDLLFAGEVVRHSLKVRANSAPQLIVECRHSAMRLQVTRSSASFFDQTDSEVLEALLKQANVPSDVAKTSYKHEQLVQFQASSWDFLLARARACGLFVWQAGPKLCVKVPELDAEPRCSLLFGATLLELDAELDSRIHYERTRAISWDASQQALREVDAGAPGLAGAGDVAVSALVAAAGSAQLSLRSTGAAEAEGQAWADAEVLRARINKTTGRAKCEGLSQVNVGDMVELSGVGRRFNGKVCVTGVRHEHDSVQGWKTHLQFGGVPEGSADISAPAAGGLLARVAGLQVGVVASNEDPAHEDRVRVRQPMVDANDEGVWARVASLDAGNGRGHFFRPELGDEVVLGFLDEDPRFPVILGMLHSSAKPAPLPGSDDNHRKGYFSRAGSRVLFDDDAKSVLVDTPAGNAVLLSESDKGISVTDQNGNSIVMNGDGITIESKKALTLKAGTDLRVESGTALELSAGTELKLEGATQAELSSGAMTAIKGGMVQIN